MAKLIREASDTENNVVVESQDAPEDIIGDTVEAAYALQLGITTHGLIYGNDDQDWFALEVVEGQQYTLTTTGSAFFQAVGQDGEEVTLNRGYAEDYGNGGAAFSGVSTFTATSSGTYYIQAVSFFDLGSRGEYSLSVSSLNAPDQNTFQTLPSLTTIAAASNSSDEGDDAGITSREAVATGWQIVTDIADDVQSVLQAPQFEQVTSDVIVPFSAGNGNDLFVFPDKFTGSVAVAVAVAEENDSWDLGLVRDAGQVLTGTGLEFLADIIVPQDFSYDILDSFRMSDDAAELFLF